jgi:putative membrane protein
MCGYINYHTEVYMKLKNKFFAVAPVMMVMAIAVNPVYAQQTQARPGAGAEHDTHAALTDGQILQIVRTLNDAEIKQASEAVDQSESAAVKQVAEMIIADHEMSNEQMDELLDGDLDLDDSPLNEALTDKGEQTHESLQDLEDVAYDCAYLQKQVAQHEEAINLAKTQLVPNAQNAAVKQFLTAMGPKLEHHLQMAKEAVGKSTGCK